MINRELIRLKTVQTVWSYYVNGQSKSDEGFAESENELRKSLDKSYELYLTMLALLLEMRRLATDEMKQQETRNRQLATESHIERRLAQNRWLAKLARNEQIREFLDNNNQLWFNEEETVRSLLRKYKASRAYRIYLESEDNFAEDQEAIRQLYKEILIDDDELAETLEHLCIYWNDDRYIVDTFLVKTIRIINQDTPDDAPLLPQYDHPDDLEFAVKLHHFAIAQGDYYHELINEHTRGWDFRRMALMDVVIMQTALAEITSFPSIPLAVSINEYVNIAKMYTAPRNSSYINATLDTIAHKLLDEKKITKSQDKDVQKAKGGQ
ncbi:MAG: transcription antitermination protein NusB [Bacteroidales bacterium]|nr:transcription antitermination protein NusB [Candidatus Physcousia equi]